MASRKYKCPYCRDNIASKNMARHCNPLNEPPCRMLKKHWTRRSPGKCPFCGEDVSDVKEHCQYRNSSCPNLQQLSKEHNAQGTLSKLIEDIRSIQFTGKFPLCELHNLELLSPDRTFSLDEPTLLNPSECWDKPCDPEDIFHALLVASWSKDSRDFQVLRNGNIVKKDLRGKAISAAFYQAHTPSEDRDVYSLMNMALPKDLWCLRPCQKLQNALHLNYQEDEQLEMKANFATTGTFVDLHIGWFSLSEFLVCKSNLILRSEPPWFVTVNWRQ